MLQLQAYFYYGFIKSTENVMEIRGTNVFTFYVFVCCAEVFTIPCTASGFVRSLKYPKCLNQELICSMKCCVGNILK